MAEGSHGLRFGPRGALVLLRDQRDGVLEESSGASKINVTDMYYADGSGTPPDPPSVELVRMKYKGVDVTELLFTLLNDEVLEELEYEIAEYMQEGGGYDPDDYTE